LFRQPLGEIVAQLREVGLPTDEVRQLADLYGGVVDRYYLLLDEIIGEFLETLPENSRIMVLSDHGFCDRTGEFPTPKSVPFTGEHRLEGTLLMIGPGIRPGSTIYGATQYDIAPTVLEMLGVSSRISFEGSSLLSQLEGSGSGEELTPVFDLSDDSPVEDSPVSEEEINRLRSLGYVE
jgi:arylsulfatase A-like enzyme